MSNRALFGRHGAFPQVAIAHLRSARAVAQILTVALLLIFCPRASALDPDFDASQYGHKSWKVRDGFVNGRVGAITQTTRRLSVAWHGYRPFPFRWRAHGAVQAFRQSTPAERGYPCPAGRPRWNAVDRNLEGFGELEGRQAYAAWRARREGCACAGAGSRWDDLGRRSSN